MGESLLCSYTVLVDAVTEFGLTRNADCIGTAVLAVTEYIDVFARKCPRLIDLDTRRSGNILEFVLRDERDDVIYLRSRFLNSFCYLLDVVSVYGRDEDGIDLDGNTCGRHLPDPCKLIRYEDLRSLFSFDLLTVPDDVIIKLRKYRRIYGINRDRQRVDPYVNYFICPLVEKQPVRAHALDKTRELILYDPE